MAEHKLRDMADGGESTAQENLKDYLGDSVYAEFDGYAITLTTENGYGPSNTIYIEPEVMAALDRYRQRFKDLRR